VFRFQEAQRLYALVGRLDYSDRAPVTFSLWTTARPQPEKKRLREKRWISKRSHRKIAKYSTP